MEEITKKVTIGVSILIGLVLTFIGGVSLTDDNVYYCEEKSLVMQCSRFSESELRCYPSLTSTKGYKDCSGGWMEIVNDTIAEPAPQNSVRKIKCNGRDWIIADDEYLNDYTKLTSGNREGYLGECLGGSK